MTPTFKTERLVLKPYAIADADALWAPRGVPP